MSTAKCWGMGNAREWVLSGQPLIVKKPALFQIIVQEEAVQNSPH